MISEIDGFPREREEVSERMWKCMETNERLNP